jgi:L-alanine-DL-glutamate epimerase-like enolase superfamily enzyme
LASRVVKVCLGMKVVKINLYKYNEPLRLEFHSTQTFRTTAESIIVQLEFENGILGYGESAPRIYVTGEDCSTVPFVIRNCFSSILFSNEITTIDNVDNVLDQLENECHNNNIAHYNSALGAIDTALLDALARFQKQPVTSLLGPIVRKKISYSISIPLLPLKKIQELFFQLTKPVRVKYVKVLVAEVENENMDRVGLVRSLFGDDVHIKVENNGKWTFRQAVGNLDRLKKFNITAVEQPLAKDDIEGLRKLKEATGIPIIVDESICSLSDAKRLIEREACDILNIKISKCGGLLRSRRIARFAEAQNILCQLGAHVGETEILREAGKSFALTTPNLVYFEGYSFLPFEDEWRSGEFEIKSDNEVGPPDFGLVTAATAQHLIEKHCSPIIELSIKKGTKIFK